MWSQKAFAEAKLEIKDLKRSLLKDLTVGRWPTDCIFKRLEINIQIQNIQNQILTCKKEQRLHFMASYIFDIWNRILAIHRVFLELRDIHYNDFTLEKHRFVLLKQTNLSNLFILPLCKGVILIVPKPGRRKKSLMVYMLLDKILQCMFFNLIDVIVEQNLKPEIFVFRKTRDFKMVVANIYWELKKYNGNKQIYFCSVDIENCFNNILHYWILKEYSFFKNYKYVLWWWLKVYRISKDKKFLSLGKVKRGVFWNFAIGCSIVNLMISNALPKTIFWKQGGRNFWSKIFSYLNKILLVSNNISILSVQLIKLIKKLKKIGLMSYVIKTKTLSKIKSRVEFSFLNFEFWIKLKKLFGNSSCFGSKKNYNHFDILLWPNLDQVKQIKHWLKVEIKKILYQPREHTYKCFKNINYILLNWGFQYCLKESYNHAKKIDSYVFKYLKKTFVKKFRYNGLLRPKWVAFNLLGFAKKNLNGWNWQPQLLHRIKDLPKIVKYIYLWACQDSFLKFSVILFSFNLKMCKKNYYTFRFNFDNKMSTLFVKRLKFNLKFRLYRKQIGLCLLCITLINEKKLLSYPSYIYVHYFILDKNAMKWHKMKKFYKFYNSKILSHYECYLFLYKNKLFKNPITLD